MKAKRLSILGSTGSIGCSALEVIVANPGRFEILALTAGRNVELLAEQIKKFKPRYAVVYSAKEADELKKLDPLPGLEISYGQEGLTQVAALPENDMVLNALVGAAGLMASLATVRAGKDLALANKESLVVGGPLFESEIEKSGAKILPIDSEHSAIWQCLKAGKSDEVRRILLTASGGPFLKREKSTFKDISREEALAHPTWKMGPKISIDSATMMNKGLELIEAVWLFSIPPDNVKIVIHPQSIVHSMVEFIDSSIIAQLSNPDMKLPIAYAIFWPERLPSDNGMIDLAGAGRLDFYEPDEEKFPALRLARKAAEMGGTAPAAVNAANEVAVESFLAGRIGFVEITELIEDILVKHVVCKQPGIDDILNCDRDTRQKAYDLIGK
ncbi:MAG: 1-deoxy-D-xylulose-5-phosphate reductoisomerase [FCB group bacterium]|nr:1-deoxy-D-xylulose-5-phosphate reductoisomerase [FCB group bacterium]